MTITELAAELGRDVKSAGEGDVVVSIHLFGIRRARELDGVPLKDLVLQAGIKPSFHTEIRKGMRLAEHVRLK